LSRLRLHVWLKLGRKSGLQQMEEYLNVKAVWIRIG